MWQMVLAHISIEGWIIDPLCTEPLLLFSSGSSPPSQQYWNCWWCTVTTDVAVVMYGRGGVSDVSWTFHQKFLRTLQYIPHHNPPCHNDICRWIHFASGLDLCLWEASGGPWCWCLPCNTPVPQTFCQCFRCSHWDHYSMVPLYKTSSGCCYWFYLLVACFLSGLFVFFWILLRAHVGYLQFLSAFFRCCSSLCNSCGLE